VPTKINHAEGKRGEGAKDGSGKKGLLKVVSGLRGWRQRRPIKVSKMGLGRGGKSGKNIAVGGADWGLNEEDLQKG